MSFLRIRVFEVNGRLSLRATRSSEAVSPTSRGKLLEMNFITGSDALIPITDRTATQRDPRLGAGAGASENDLHFQKVSLLRAMRAAGHDEHPLRVGVGVALTPGYAQWEPVGRAIRLFKQSKPNMVRPATQPTSAPPARNPHPSPGAPTTMP